MAEIGSNKYVLYSVLDWGLGHATRSIPIINALQSKGYEVIICSDKKVAKFLKQELGDFKIEHLPSYDIEYRHNSMVINMLLQLPKIYRSFRKERRIFSKLVDKYNPVFTISDNRYGCQSDKSPSYFLGHQWSILDGKGSVHRLASMVNQYFIKKFDFMIIPDISTHQYSGKLSASVPKEFALFSGVLSRFTKTEYFTDQKKYDVGIILSGPEPSRTKLEQKILKLFPENNTSNVLLIRGTNRPMEDEIPSHIDVKNLVNSTQLGALIDACSLIVSRSGYSSIMDYIRLGVKRIVFIPTSGQTEQEYLARLYQDQYGIPYLEESKMEELLKILRQLSSKKPVEITEMSLNNLIETIETQLVN